MTVHIGKEAIDRPSTITFNVTSINAKIVAVSAGGVTSIDIRANTNLGGCKIGIFYLIAGGKSKCRSAVTIGNVAAGFQTITGLALAVEIGDMIGLYYTSGAMERSTSGEDGLYWSDADQCVEGKESTQAVGFLSDDAVSIGGYIEVTPPTVTTQACTAAAETTATGNGNITGLGASLVIQHGVVYSASEAIPTLSNALYTEEGAAGTGAFTSSMTELTRDTRYYVRAYATNSFGTGYGEVVELNTDPTGIIQMAFGQSIFTESPDWTSVSDDALSLGIKRGRVHDLDRIEAGTATIVLKNLDGNYWRYNTDGDYTPNVKPLTLVRVSVVWAGNSYRRFYGMVESFRHGWLDGGGGKLPIVTVSCVDVFKGFSRFPLLALTGAVGSYTGVAAITNDGASGDSGQKTVQIKSLAVSSTEGSDIALLHAGQSVTIGDDSHSEVNTIASIDADTYILTMTANLTNSYTTGAHGYVKKFPSALAGVRVNDILSEFGWPPSLRDIDAGQLLVAELVPQAGGLPGLEHMFDVVESEGGIVFVSGRGLVVFQDRDARLDPTADKVTCLEGTSIALNASQATFSDDGSDQKYVAAEPEDDDTFIYNEARVNGDSITEQVYRDPVYQALQGPRSLVRKESLLTLNGDAFDQAYAIVERYKNSALRVASLTVVPDADPANLYTKVLLYDLSTMINLELVTSPNVAMLDKNYHIEGIEDTFAAGGSWSTRWQLWDVNLFRIFQAAHTGYLEKTSAVSYEAAHDAVAADTAYDDNVVIGVGQLDEGGAVWYLWRGFMQFVTSTIGAAGSIASAEIVLEITGYFAIDNEFDLTLVYAGAGIAYPLAVGDYNTMMGQTTSYGSVTISPSTENKRVIVISLNAAGIAAINKTGTTYFGLRTSRDISETAPGIDKDEMLSLSGMTTDVVPRLIVKLN